MPNSRDTSLGQGCQQVRHWGAIAKGCAHVGIKVHVAGSEDEGPPQLEWVPAELVLPVAGSLRACPRGVVIGAQKVEHRSDAEIDGAVGDSIRVDQERESNAGVLAEDASVLHVAESDGGNPGAFELEAFFSFAQLRDMLAAEDSTVVPEKRNHAR